MLHTMHQTTQQQLTQAQQMLHEMQHRYDRLLEAPRPAPPARAESPPRPPGPAEATRGEMRRRILDLLRHHPEGLTPAEMRTSLRADKSLADTCLGMLRYGLVQRVGRGRYVVAEPSRQNQP
jgi:hypothetical protein